MVELLHLWNECLQVFNTDSLRPTSTLTTISSFLIKLRSSITSLEEVYIGEAMYLWVTQNNLGLTHS